MKSRKGYEKMFGILISLVLVMVLVAVYFSFFRGGLSRGTSNLNQQFDSAGDADNDGVINIADKCPCSSQGLGVPDNEGCPADHKITNDGKGPEDRSCFIKK